MIFTPEEKAVEEEFAKNFSYEIGLYTSIMYLYGKLLKQVRSTTAEYDKYSIALLVAINFKSYISAFDRLKKGYLGDSEAIFKRTIESMLAQGYFYHYKNKAKDYCSNILRIKSIKDNRKKLAQYLDKLNNKLHFFPTNEEKFFEKYIYEVGYGNANVVAHLDFEAVHREIGLNGTPGGFATTLVIGPKFDRDIMKVTLSRLIMFSNIQLTLIHKLLNINEELEYKTIFKRVIDYFSK